MTEAGFFSTLLVAARLLDELAERAASKVGDRVQIEHEARCHLATRR